MAPYSRSYGRTLVATVLDSESEGLSLVGKTIRVGGWVKTGREAGAGAFAFLEVNDGSCFQNIQVRFGCMPTLREGTAAWGRAWPPLHGRRTLPKAESGG